MKKLLILLLLPALFSCKTTRYNTRETAKSNTEIKTDIREEVKVLEEKKSADNISQLTDEQTTIIERITTIKLSAPDVANNQYPVEVTTTEREISKGKTVKTDATSSTEQKAESITQKVDNTQTKVHTETEKVDKTVVKKTTPAWVTWSVIVVVIGILFFAFLFLKKYRIL